MDVTNAAQVRFCVIMSCARRVLIFIQRIVMNRPELQRKLARVPSWHLNAFRQIFVFREVLLVW